MFTEHAEQNESELYSQLTNRLSARMDQLYGNAERAFRDTHAKSHAAVRAHVQIFDINESAIKQELAQRTALPQQLIDKITIRQGLFAQPGLYPAWLRFANGKAECNPDGESDTRSMSVKIIGVAGERLSESCQSNAQDIITQNCDIFFIRSIASYLSFLRAAFKPKLLTLLWLIFHQREFRALKTITKFAPQSLLTERYWSGSAYALGLPANSKITCPASSSVTYPAVVKYAFTPCQPEAPFHELPRQKLNIPARSVPENYYREELAAALAQPHARYCWNIGIQFQTTEAMSIDDITVPWSEQQSPFFTVGRMFIDHQQIDLQRQSDFCENLVFSPWNGLKVHRPVGALNRLRRLAYPLVAAYRLKKRGVSITDLTGHETP